MSLIHNERTKLTANWMNALASGSIITGVVAPLIAVTFGLSNVSVGILLLSALFWLSAGVALNFSCKTHSREIAAMTFVEAFALFGMPFVVLAIGYGVYCFTREPYVR